jgi:predicted XRE-type DNA-binding protein
MLRLGTRALQEQLAQFMQPMGLTQAALAEAMGVQRKHVNELCNDRRLCRRMQLSRLRENFGAMVRCMVHSIAGTIQYRPTPNARVKQTGRDK